MSDSIGYGNRAASPRRLWRNVAVSVVVLGVLGAVVVGIVLMPAQTAPTPPAQIVPVNVKVWRVAPQPEMADTFDLTAVIEPEAVVRVAAEVSARVERWGERTTALAWQGRTLPVGAPLEEGQPIRAGEPIMYLNQDMSQARHDQAAAQFEYDQREFERVERLFAEGNTSRTELDNARSRRDISKALLDATVRELERTTIMAPRSGILNRLLLEPGEYAGPGDPVAELVDINQVKVAVDVPERDVYCLEVGQTAEVFVRGPQELRRTGQITYISALADERTRTTRVWVTLDNADHFLRSGQIVKVRLTREVLRDVVMIPLGSVIPLEEGRVVYVVDDGGLAERRLVELDFMKGHDVRVLNGLTAGDRLIVAGHRFVAPGQPVTVVEEVTR